MAKTKESKPKVEKISAKKVDQFLAYMLRFKKREKVCIDDIIKKYKELS